MASWARRGYFVIRGFAESDRICDLRCSCDVVLDQIRAESNDLGHSKANIAYLTEPKYFIGDRNALTRLLEFVGSLRVRNLISGLSHPDEQPLLFHNTQYFHEQTMGDWDGNWHRDSQFCIPDAEAERQFALTTTAVHFCVAFVSDDRLEFVPGSHARWDTTDEYQIRKGSVPNGLMPDSNRIALEAGDACVFHGWGIHRGTYRRTPIRRTLDIIYGFGPCQLGPAIPPPTCFKDSQILRCLSPDARRFFEDFVSAYRLYWTSLPTDMR
jgi:ectoine hydroxylase-related dioxygenase (phytanoyl-CoA dioxygenase family)